MEHKVKSIRPFIGSKDFELSRNFYRDLGFEEIVLEHNISYFKTAEIGFYLQNAFVKEWINNTMIFMEVDDVKRFYSELIALNLTSKYDAAKLIPVRELP